MPTPPHDLRHIQALVEIVSALRGPQGCPWDIEQTHHSLTPYTIEECFEMVEAIESNIDEKMKDEMGDVLFQVVLHAQLAKERGAFDLLDVIENLAAKLIRRHPHVFSNVKVGSTQDVIENWEKIKKLENNTKNPYSLDVPKGLPALQRAHKIGKRTEKIGFDWDNADQVYEKVVEEQNELKDALASKDLHHIKHEIGDLFFSLAQLSRHLDLDPEQILRQANLRFEKRFETMLELSKLSKEEFGKISLTEKENWWQKAKAACHDLEK